ncbi:contractile injection system protein, VgrG/Pvc8 family [Polyangium sp. y55x31]|uniref:contractile injection system protein, VgrG/Pvc8 family n=1 Tax=Polyangium sp. y55x31 TaxID=3042688 RepID=UPI002482727F|nr:contractile injection system protein, VgrG/Pvc8 family [Polyangium sp. y55x31]MDI1476542.1 contractile injection system protein, VgrG/Pvc8 family [Polyangium sp. y55x31]
MSLSATFGFEGGASRPSEAPFQLLVFPLPFNHFTVRSFRGREELSGIYSFDIVVTGPDIGEGTVERLSLGQRALLVLRAGKAPRVFHGIVASVRHEGLRGAHGASQFRMRLVSRLWLLKHRRRSRIFQNQRIDRILAQVLGEVNIDARFLLRGEHPVREYCTQYEETDYQFVRRITAER